MINRRNFVSTAAATLALSAVPALAAIPNVDRWDGKAFSWIWKDDKVILRSEIPHHMMDHYVALTGRCWFDLMNDVLKAEEDTGLAIGYISYQHDRGSTLVHYTIDAKRTLFLRPLFFSGDWHQ